jgi:integrase
VLNQARRRPQFTVLQPQNRELIINTLIKLNANGKAKATLEETSYRLTRLAEQCNLSNPEEVKTTIANMTTANQDKQNYVNAYARLLTSNEMKWKRPYYKSERRIPTIPTRENLMKIISNAKKYAPIFKTLMETGLMPYELSQVEQRDIDLERGILSARGYKGHTSRTFKLTQETTAMLKEYFGKYQSFPESVYIGKMWRKARNKTAKKLQDVALKTIRLYDLRHYYATTLYAKTRDILLVKQQLGHHKIETTMIYTQLIHFNEEEEYTVKTANNISEASQLIEHGFEYITEIDGIKIFRKRK